VQEPFYTNVFNVNYQFKPDTTARQLTADADYIAYRNHSDGYLTSSSYDLGGQPLEPTQRLNFHQPSFIDIRSLKADAVLPAGRWLLRTGLKYAAASITNDFRYDSLRGGRFERAPSLSNQFRYHERIAAAYLTGHGQLAGISLDAGLRVEHSAIDANSLNTRQRRQYDYINFFPSLVASYSWGTAHRLGLTLSRRLNRPNYTDLNPTRDYFDRYQFYQGNPNLVPETAWTTALTYTWRDEYSATLRYSRASNFIARSASTDPISNVLLLSRANYPHRDRLEIQLLAPVTLTSYWSLNTSATLSYTAYPVPQEAGSRQVSLVAVDLYAAQTLRLPKGVAAELTARYNSPTLNGVYVARRYFSVDGGAKKSFLRDKLEARLSFTDLFHTAWLWGYSLSEAAPYSYRDVNDSRRVTATLTYHLGGKLTTGRSHRTDEEGRL
jgi:outer membrane receptor protein involved in Fe transport